MRNVCRTGLFVLLLLSLIVSGCGFGADQTVQELDAPPIEYVDEGVSLDTDDVEVGNKEDAGTSEGAEEEEEMINRELYLFDENGLVVPQTFSLPKTQGVLQQSLEYLVQEGPLTNLLPNGFRAVLPPGTEILGVNLTDDGVAVADFSTHFKEYNPEDELKITQAITWTLTQFDNVERVQIWINGHEQEMMPVNGTPIGEGLTRSNGINHESSSVVDMVDSKGVTLYFLAQNADNVYYVPVTRRVDSEEDVRTAVVSELLSGPSLYSNLLTDFREEVELLEDPTYENGVVTLNFNEAILNQLEGVAISNEVLDLLVLSLTEQEGVEKVAIQVNGESNVLQASGETLAEPVTRPNLVNTGSF